jgi:hypothetical protein
MKKTLLSIFALIFAGASYAQVCIPNPAYADEVFGVWPTPEDGFEVGNVGVIYGQTLDFIIPSDAGQIDPLGAGQIIDSVVVLSIVGLHDGLTFGCASHTPSNCTFLPEIQGCGVISGVPTVAGNNTLAINALAYVTLFGNVVPIPYTFEGYSLEVLGPQSVAEMAQFGLKLSQNMPNPFSQTSVIEFSLNQSLLVEFNVYDLVGRNIHSRGINASAGMNRINLDATSMGLTTGVYLYTLTINGQSVTRKMVVK